MSTMTAEMKYEVGRMVMTTGRCCNRRGGGSSVGSAVLVPMRIREWVEAGIVTGIESPRVRGLLLLSRSVSILRLDDICPERRNSDNNLRRGNHQIKVKKIDELGGQGHSLQYSRQQFGAVYLESIDLAT
jgi:hypothetical protein